MKAILLFFLVLLSFHFSFSQATDFIAIKKSHKTEKSYFAGGRITFITPVRTYSGVIRTIQHDSVFIIEYDIRQMPTTLGFFIPDTVTTYKSAIYYKDILKIYSPKTGFDITASGGSLFGGGILLTTIGLGTWIFTKPGQQYHASPAFVGASAALTGIGYLLLRSHRDYFTFGKKYTLEYIRVK